MTLEVHPAVAPVEVPAKTRVLNQEESHVVSMAVTRLDGNGNLVSVVIDLTKGTASFRQETHPFTAKSPEDIDDLIEFYSTARRLLAEAPAPVTLPAATK